MIQVGLKVRRRFADIVGMKLLAPTTAQWRKLPRRGQAAAQVDSLMVVKHAQPQGRVGFVVSKKIFGNAIVRNTVTRRLRVAAQAALEGAEGCWIVIPRAGSEQLSSDELTQLLVRARRKIERKQSAGQS